MIKAVPIPLASGSTGWVHAGPTRDLPAGYRLIACAEEIEIDPEIIAFDVRTKDFQPFNHQTVTHVLIDMLEAIEAGEPLYVGCMGGTGRTGTLLAILVSQHPAFTGQTAIKYVRDNYKPGAVETQDQMRQVEDFAQDADMMRAFFEEPPTEIVPPRQEFPETGLFSRLWHRFIAG